MSANPEVVGDNEDESVARRIKGTLEEVFDPQNNALNAWRLAMATGVILWHSWLITGRTISFEPAHQLLRDVWVDGFFAISGFLITWSWTRRPRLRDYFVARGLRILPGFWVCLVVIAFVIAPISVAIQGGSPGGLLLSSGPISYVLNNFGLLMRQSDIAGTPLGVPLPGEWDSSLWTLYWEALCYIAIAVLGITGLLRRRWVVPSLLALAVLWSTQLPSMSAIVEAPPDKRPPLDAATQMLIAEGAAARFAVMFLAGALLFQVRHVIPARWSLVALSVAIVLAASLLPNYRWIGAFPLAYALVVSGALIHDPRLRLRTDLSYGVYIYAFPIQQILVICGLAFLAPPVFALIAAVITLPLAALSWFLVEKPAMSLKARLGRRGPPAAAPPA
ncbi:peptidoglycan/LPS O-acetylase OafA/YrhL [Mycolicibacterium sp. BK634]|uniref:acyltransferase family protein n=1 Tax=Mycobacteriaceae TaxID=1762 RepID=UPI001061299B|nr:MULTISPECIES: acyltransferase [Mycobacteriaceae]MBB3753008.1 peptidoglycan/LPS O-acetylase OafA/YrhL [Mycolicibacterium sp. BK634]TDO09224.1 peptidoglycan/LPS O-acetylase OafA/YrhL [Mycobacterium sp. BK086]